MTAPSAPRLLDASSSDLVRLLAQRQGPDVVAVVLRAADVADGDDDALRLRVTPAARRVARALGVDLDRRLRRARPGGRTGEVVDLQVQLPEGEPGEQVESLLVVCAGPGGAETRDWVRAGAALARRTRGRSRVLVDLPVRDPRRLRAFVEGLGLASYSFSRRSRPADGRPPRVDLLLPSVDETHEEAVATALAVVDAVHRARDLANTPSSEKSPAWLAAQAERAVRGTGVRVRVRDERALEAGGFGGLLAVGAGSPRPPRLVEMRWAPRGSAGAPHVVLVGKGITFDTGGLSLKPSDGMTTMKTDMSGGAVVVAVMAALQRLGVQVRVTGLVAAAENMPSGGAQRPGDVITHYGGTTSEVLNTDAEGRLVLADALAYAVDRLEPDALVDVATLTGAASLGLGRRHAALFASDDRLARALERAADAAGERLWRMPLVEDYRAALDSDVADLAHVSRDPHVSGGAITAALFLREFTGGVPWAHLDVAGPARSDADADEVTKGATGWGVRTLLRWLETL